MRKSKFINTEYFKKVKKLIWNMVEDGLFEKGMTLNSLIIKVNKRCNQKGIRPLDKVTLKTLLEQFARNGLLKLYRIKLNKDWKKFTVYFIVR